LTEDIDLLRRIWNWVVAEPEGDPMVRSIVRMTLGLLTAAVLTGAAVAVGSSPASAAPDGLTLVAVRDSLLETHYWYRQTYQGHPVLGGFYARHVDHTTGAVSVTDGRRTVGTLARTLAVFSEGDARAVAGRTGGQPYRSELVVVPGVSSVLAWDVTSDTGRGSTRTVVDAATGGVLVVESLVKHVDGSGRVFDPNPVVTLQNEGLTDANNADLAVFGPAYKNVTLTRLDGSGQLRGSFARNVSASAVKSTTNTFVFNRSQAGFEQTMGYYQITRAQEYIQSLGFTNVNNEGQKYRTTGLKDDNSFYDPATDRLTFGTGGVDDAEDAEVIWHEYGHAIQDAQVPGFGSTEEAGAIGEGFGDYWAFTMSTAVSSNTATTPLACIADWDSTSYTTGTPHCLRRVDGTKVYPRDVEGEVHADGEIWSRALFDIHAALGRTNANKVILEAQFSFAPDTTFKAAAQTTVATAQRLFGTPAANACRTAFHNRGIL
jgi:Zn-dependent metalloprotease